MNPPPNPRRKHTWGRRLWTLHRWLGLCAGLILLGLGFSGALLLLDSEIKSTLEARAHRITPPTSPNAESIALNPILARLETLHPGLLVASVQWPEKRDRAIEVNLRRPASAEARLITLNPWTGEVLSDQPRQQTLRSWALRFHHSLFLGKYGLILTSFGALSLTLLALTGLWLNRHILRTLSRLPMRVGRGPRLAWSDLHKWSGSASFVILLILGLTGCVFMVQRLPGAFSSRGGHQHGAAPRDARLSWEQLPEATLLRAKAQSALPDHEFSQLTFPTAHQPAFNATLLDRQAWWWDKRATASFDSSSGKLLSALSGPERPAKARALSAISALHFGLQGAAWVKWLYLALGAIAPGVLSVTGFFIWFIRTRKKKSTHLA